MILDKIIYRLRTGIIFKNIKENVVVCDLGCRKNVTFLKQISSKIKYGYGFDIDAENYKESNIETKKLNFESERIPLGDQSVDCILMSAVLEHLNDPKNIIKEAYRILGPGGVFLLTTPSVYAKPILEFLAFKLKIISREDISEHKKYYKTSDIVKLFANCGFDEKNVKCKYFELFFNILVIAKK